MKDFTKWWISGVASVTSFVANLATATSWLEDILVKQGVDFEKAEQVNDFFLGITPILFTITLIVFIFYSAVNICSKELSKSGTHGITQVHINADSPRRECGFLSLRII